MKPVIVSFWVLLGICGGIALNAYNPAMKRDPYTGREELDKSWQGSRYMLLSMLGAGAGFQIANWVLKASGEKKD